MNHRDLWRDALERLFSLRRFGVRPSLEGIGRALDLLGHPEKDLRVIHIAGTNGKGSTAAFCESLLSAANCRTGLYTSPHLLRFTERIRVGGAEISEDEVIRYVSLLSSLELTFFELVTAMAFAIFRDRKVDAAVVEVGLGGRWDATNVVRPLASVVTGIALDHVEILGGTLQSIAREKAGIFKKNVPAVAACKDESARAVLVEEAARAGAPLELLGRNFFPYGGELGLLGAHQADNAALALRAVERAGFALHPEALAKTRWPGRLEWLAPDVLVDAAHNPDGAASLAAALPKVNERLLTFVIGVVDDKDAAGIVAPLLPLAERVIFTRPPSPRALDPQKLLPLFPSAEVIPDVAAAIARARSFGVAVVCGSIFLVGEARRVVLGEAADPISAQDPAARKL